jgi:hypothetical protein
MCFGEQTGMHCAMQQQLLKPHALAESHVSACWMPSSNIAYACTCLRTLTRCMYARVQPAEAEYLQTLISSRPLSTGHVRRRPVAYVAVVM